MVYGAALEKRQWACHLVPLDTTYCYLVKAKNDFCIWLCHPVLGDAKQFVGKMSAKQRPPLENCQGASKVKGRDF